MKKRRTMRVTVKQVRGDMERRIVTGMIVSDQYMRQALSVLAVDRLESPYARTVASWCLQYFKQYGKAPQQHIQDLFHSHTRKGMDSDLSELVESFLSSISDEYANSDKLNVPYLLDQTREYFTTKALRELSEDISTELANGNTMQAETLLSSYKKTSLPTNDTINPFTDKEEIFQSFENNVEPLFTLPGAIGDAMNEQFVRGGLVGFMGREKIGKTWFLMDLAVRAVRARCNVVFFGVGDMSRAQMVRRFHVRISGRSNRPRYCRETLIPVVDCKRNQLNMCRKSRRSCSCGVLSSEEMEAGPEMKEIYKERASSKYKPCALCRDRRISKFSPSLWYKLRPAVEQLTWREGFRNGVKLTSRLKGRDFKQVDAPTKTLKVSDINNRLQMWEWNEGFVADVVIIDYADILAPENGNKDFRHQENEKWEGMRALSLSRHCLVITATQANAASYNVRSLGMENFSEDKRKYAHVTAMYGLNQTTKEKRNGVMRVGSILMREDDFSVEDEVTVLQSLHSGKPLLDSFLAR